MKNDELLLELVITPMEMQQGKPNSITIPQWQLLQYNCFVGFKQFTRYFIASTNFCVCVVIFCEKLLYQDNLTENLTEPASP